MGLVESILLLMATISRHVPWRVSICALECWLCNRRHDHPKVCQIYDIAKGLFRVKMHSLLLRPGSENSISLWCKLRHTIDLTNYGSWFPFWENCFVWLKFLFFYFFKTCTKPFCKLHYTVIVISITRHVLYTGKWTRLYILEIIKTWPLCILWTRGHAYLLTQLYKIKNVWIMILKQKAFEKLAQIMKLKEKPRGKKATCRYWNRI